jgi:hypothetical protein
MMLSSVFVCVCAVVVCFGSAVQYIAFDSASASSVYSTGNDLAFAASAATSTGSGYWCSSGGHKPEQVVVFLLLGYLSEMFGLFAAGGVVGWPAGNEAEGDGNFVKLGVQPERVQDTYVSRRSEFR